jgi:ATP-dependent DNA helicase
LISLFDNGLNGILADEMGLGKTIQVIAFLSHLRINGVFGPFLIVAPLSTLPNWTNEIQKWCPSMKVQKYHGSKDERKVMRGAWGKNLPVIVTSYEVVMNDKSFFQKIKWKMLIVDEGHRLKNMDCKLIKVLKDFPSENRLLLSGTPLQNSLRELWSLLNFLLPTIFDSLQRFESWFNFEVQLQGEEGREALIQDEREHQIVTKLHDVLRPFVMRRIKADVATDLPGKREFVLYTPLAPFQKEIYRRLLQNELDQLPGCGNMRNLLMQLRKVCNHPYLIAEPHDELGALSTDSRIISFCGKLQVVDQLLNRLKAGNHKVLLFSQMTALLNIMEDYFTFKEWQGQYCRIDGGVDASTRQQQIDLFNNDPSVWLFMLSTRAGGQGINLQAADTVIIYDSDWNPHQDSQAQDRCHRIGQTAAVRVYRLISPNTVEMNMLQRAQNKRQLEELVISRGNFSTPQMKRTQKTVTQDFAAELVQLFERESQMEQGMKPLLEAPDLKPLLPSRCEEAQAKVAMHESESRTCRQKGKGKGKDNNKDKDKDKGKGQAAASRSEEPDYQSDLTSSGRFITGAPVEIINMHASVDPFTGHLMYFILKEHNYNCISKFYTFLWCAVSYWFSAVRGHHVFCR